VNRAVSFNTIKGLALVLLFLSELETESLPEWLMILFMINSCLERKGGNPAHLKSSYRTFLDFINDEKTLFLFGIS